MARGVLVWAVLAGVLPAATPLPAQVVVARNAPRPAESVPSVTSIVPPGATLGGTTEWTVTGRNLAHVEGFRISGGGVEVAEITKRSNGSLVALVRTRPDAAPGFREVYAEAPDGLSNLMVVRVDALGQTAETEPNDDPAHATELPRGTAAVGVLKPQDLDHFRIPGKAGERLTIEVEAQRLGAPIVPVVTVLTPEGAALALGRRSRGEEQDCRLSYTLPRDGAYVIQVRDNVYGGGDSAVYRLRVESAPFATGLFPLGGPRGQSVTVTASGGNLGAPRSKTIDLPDQPGAVVAVGPIDGLGGPVVVAQRLAVGDGPEVFEDRERPATSLPPLGRDGGKPTLTVNGRIDRPGEVDRYVLPVKRGDQVRIKVQAARLGSWLDSVVTVRDASGSTLAENDDPGGNPGSGRGGLFGLADGSPDSLLDYEAGTDGDLRIEVTDRYGDGGPEYAYRLILGTPRPDFEIKLLISNPSNQLLAVGRRSSPGFPAANGTLNLKPGATLPLNFLIAPEGRPGPVVVRAEGLPPGVTAEPVTVRLTGSAGGRRAGAPPSSGALVLRVAPNASTAVGDLRVVATARLEDGTTLTREATGSVVLEPAGATDPPPVRVVSHIPVKVVGTPRSSPPALPNRATGPVALKSVTVPGALLQGGFLDLGLELEPPDARPDRFDLRAEPLGQGLEIADPRASTANPAEGGAAVRVVAAVGAAPGVKSVRIRFHPTEGRDVEREVPVIVRPPIRVAARPGRVVIPPGGTARLWVGVEREPGYLGPVELRVAGLPEGVKAPGRFVVPPEALGGEIRLVRDPRSRAPIAPVAVRVSGTARMPRGPVSVDSAIRPMVSDRAAEE